MTVILAAAALCVAVDGDRILARDLAPVLSAFAALAPETEIAYAPAPGAHREFRSAELARLALKNGASPGELRPVCVERATEPLTRERLEGALRTAIARQDATIEIADFSRFPAPRGEIVFPRAGISRERETVLWKGYVAYGANRRFGVWVRARITAPVSRVVAREALPGGVPVRPEQLRVEQSDAFPLGEQPASAPDQVAGRAPRRSIPAGAAIDVGLLEARQEIHAGDTVAVEVRSGRARLSFEGRAGAPGRQGEIIPVRNPETGKTLRARVEGPGKAVMAVAAPAGGNE